MYNTWVQSFLSLLHFSKRFFSFSLIVKACGFIDKLKKIFNPATYYTWHFCGGPEMPDGLLLKKTTTKKLKSCESMRNTTEEEKKNGNRILKSLKQGHRQLCILHWLCPPHLNIFVKTVDSTACMSMMWQMQWSDWDTVGVESNNNGAKTELGCSIFAGHQDLTDRCEWRWVYGQFLKPLVKLFFRKLCWTFELYLFFLCFCSVFSCNLRSFKEGDWTSLDFVKILWRQWRAYSVLNVGKTEELFFIKKRKKET